MKKRIYHKLPPNHIKQLIEKRGMKETINVLGLSKTAVDKYIRDDEAPQVTELAAQLLLGENQQMRFAVIKIDPRYLPVIEKFAEVTMVG